MTGAYYPPYAAPPPVPDNFEDYMWMENEEEFDKQVMQQLEEEALMEQCIEAMLEDEQRERHRTVSNGHCATTSSGSCNLSLEETISRSTLNPLAAEFVPSRISQTNTQTEEKQENPELRQEDKTEEEKVEEVEAVVDNVIENKEATEDTGFKPINYAAAAKANKPKKPEQDKPKSDKPAEKPKSEKPAEKPKSEKPVKPADKDKKPLKEKPKVKTDKPVQRKNSAK
ncbi:putative polyA-binding protein interacting [Danaus plexippus plexippus]|uniref:PolyA-binding protein interacting n=1 Tax=Danaus plexippus plexippus TaxID=278856 RepID=A0A212ENH8_DANPL|nr:putative polyA-binding protein interacting [Danaus plexippus plexippus]